MSQYPSPYQPPMPNLQPGYAPPAMYDDPLLPAKRASVLMIVLGVLMLLYGICNGASTFIINSEQFEKQMQMFAKDAPPPLPMETMRTLTVVFSAVVVLTAIFLLATSLPVRRGSPMAINIAMVGVIVICAALGFFTLLMLLAGFAMPAAFIGACLGSIPSALFVLLAVWLVQASRGSGRMRMMQAQYQAQYMQYQQMMQQYGQPAGFGYAYPPPPAPPASQPPPTAPGPDSTPPQSPT